MEDQELLHVSRHQTLNSLRRYLNFGTKSGENLRRAKRVQEVLAESEEEGDAETADEDDEMSSLSSSSSITV
jgi:hypothetical protein